MKSPNHNIFAGDRPYKTNFFLKFRSDRIESKFRQEIYTRNRFSIQGYLFFTLAYLIIQFMSSDCFLYYNNCRHGGLLLVNMIFIILAFACLHYRHSPNYLRASVLIMLLYPQMLILDKYHYDTSMILLTIYTSLAALLLCNVWSWSLLYNTLSYSIMLGYLHITSNLSVLKKPWTDFLTDLVFYNAAAIVIIAFIEKARKEKWVLVDSFKKSERIFRTIYEKLPYAFFVIDKTKRVHYTNVQGLTLLSHYFSYSRSCNLSKMNLNLQAILQESSIPGVDAAITAASTEQSSSCFVSLKIPELDAHSDSLYSFEKDNQYKVLITPVLWKNTFAYLVAIKDYSTKTKSEKISSKAFAYLTKEIERITSSYDTQTTERQLKVKVKMLAQLDKFKLSILNTTLMFHRIFNNNKGLAEKKSFNIRQNILAMMGTMSVKAREQTCDLVLTFESFPDKLYGDEYLFQQIFFNILKMLLERLKNTKIVVDCRFKSFLQENCILLSIEFQIPKNNYLSYEEVSAKLESTRNAVLDHLLDEDEVSFYFAIVRPAIELFHGNLLVEEGNEKYFIRVEIESQMTYQGDDNIKERTVVRHPTLKSCNYNASGQSKGNVYYWNHEEPENEHEAGAVQEPVIANGVKSLPSKNNGDEIRPPIKVPPIDASGKGNRKENQHKIREELRKMALVENKNFGGQEDKARRNSVPLIKMESDLAKKAEDNVLSRTKTEKSVTLEEDKDDREEPEKIEIENQAKKDPLLENASSLSVEKLERLSESVKYHERHLKLALAKTLLGILDNFERKEKEESPDANDLTAPLILRDVGEELKACGLNDNEIYKKVIGHLGENLMNHKYRDNFTRFMRQYKKQVEDEIYSINSANNESEFTTAASFSELPNEEAPNSPDILRRALSLTDKKYSGYTRAATTRYDRDSPPDSERSKGRNLNERILLTPSVSKSLRLTSGKTFLEKNQMKQFAQYFSGAVLKPKSTQSVEEIKQKEEVKEKDKVITLEVAPKKQLSSDEVIKMSEIEKIEDLKKKLMIIGRHDNLPDFLAVRFMMHHRKWIGLPHELVKGANMEEKCFTYNKVFTILAVDDSEFVFKGLESLPAKFERKFDFAKNGTEALKKYLHSINQGILYHFVLMDLQMPVMDGFETARNIRAEETEKGYPRTYICAMSAFEDHETINKAKREGMDNFCQKPLRTEVLNNLIKTRLEEIEHRPSE